MTSLYQTVKEPTDNYVTVVKSHLYIYI